MSWRVRVRLSGQDRNQAFSEECETLVVNLHGCALQCPRPLRPGTPIHLEVAGLAGRVLRGRVMDAVALGEDRSRWMMGIALEQAGNHWGIQYPPEDWAQAPAPAPDQVVATKSLPPQAPAASDGMRRNLEAPAQETAAPLPQTSRPPVAAAPPITDATQAAVGQAMAPPAPAAPVAHSVLQEIQERLLQLQQTQAKQESLLLQERAEREAARTAAEQAMTEQLERMRQAKDYIESLVCSLPSLIEAQAQEQARAIARRIQPETLQAEMEKLIREGRQASEAALEQRTAGLGEELRRQLQERFEQDRQAQASALRQLQELEQRANHLSALVELELQNRAEEIVAEAVAEIRKEVEAAIARLRAPSQNHG